MIKLRPHQERMLKESVPILEVDGIVYIVGKPRTGKTLTALFVANAVGAKNVICFTKKRAIDSIRSDYDKTGFDFEFTVTNYEQAHKYKPEFDLVIVDEAHNIGKFPKPSKRAKLIKPLVGKNPLILLSGTPTPESYSQIYHQLWVSDLSPYKNYTNFYRWADHHVLVSRVKFGRAYFNDYSDAMLEVIEPEINHLFVSCTQEQAGFSAKVDEKVIEIPMTDRQKSLIDILLKDRIYPMKDGESVILGDTAVKLQNKIHQICSGTVITQRVDNERATSRVVLETTKAQYIKDNYKGQKIAIFTLFQAEKEALALILDNITHDSYEFEERDDLIFVGQFQSHSEGVKLLSADVIIMYNIMFSSVKYQQSIERSQDFVRSENSQVHWLMSEGGIEQKIYDKVINKLDYTNSYFKQDYEVK